MAAEKIGWDTKDIYETLSTVDEALLQGNGVQAEDHLAILHDQIEAFIDAAEERIEGLAKRPG